ncbi:MAG: hypothetical protein H6632_19650 [Anaerolineales bacterium]|nr:hypothetical protein [Anaerolineales bacterium]
MCSGARQPGGVTGYPSDRLREEVAYLAYHFHWPYDQIMRLEHRERLWWVQEVAKINTRLMEKPGIAPGV